MRYEPFSKQNIKIDDGHITNLHISNDHSLKKLMGFVVVATSYNF